MLGFWDIEKVRGTSNEIFSLVIIAMIGIFNISGILIDSDNSCNILYFELLEKMGLERGSLWSLKGSDLQVFNCTTT